MIICFASNIKIEKGKFTLNSGMIFPCFIGSSISDVVNYTEKLPLKEMFKNYFIYKASVRSVEAIKVFNAALFDDGFTIDVDIKDSVLIN